MTVRLPLSAADESGWLRLPFPHPAWMSTRSSGDMRQADNRNRLYARIGVPADRVMRLTQVHSRTVLAAEDLVRPREAGPGNRDRDLAPARDPQRDPDPNPDPGPDPLATPPEGDGLVSARGGPYLAVGVGDCMPIVLCDLRTGAYAALHSGWRGTGILAAGLDEMRVRYGTDPTDVVALFGPCISGESYEVDEARGEEYRRWGPGAVVQRGDRPYLDMRAANLELARRAGIGSVVVADNCTFQTPQLGSFRRDGSGYAGMLVIVGPRDREEGS